VSYLAKVRNADEPAKNWPEHAAAHHGAEEKHEGKETLPSATEAKPAEAAH